MCPATCMIAQQLLSSPIERVSVCTLMAEVSTLKGGGGAKSQHCLSEIVFYGDKIKKIQLGQFVK